MGIIKRFIECLIPVTACNLKCSYCYVVQRHKNSGKMPEMKYSGKQIRMALSQKRLGGVCYISICGAGETMLPMETLLICKELLEEGHYVNITTNGTLTKRFEQLISMLSKEELERLHFAFSFHYLELMRLNKMDDFFSNIKKVKNAGCSFLVQLNLCDEYIPFLDSIKKICLENVGAFPQIAATRKETDIRYDVELMTSLTIREYKEMGDQFNSPLFDFTMENFNKERKEFCYSGDWAFTLNLATGIMKRCYGCNKGYNIFDKPESPIPFCAIGYHCTSLFCMNSSHFLSMGVIPELITPCYAELRDRKTTNGENWYSDIMREALSSKLKDSNSEKKHALKIEAYYILDTIYGILARQYAGLKSRIKCEKEQ